MGIENPLSSSGAGYGVAMDYFTIAVIGQIAFWLFGVIVGLWILWAIIRGAVLSALRKHAEETAEQQAGRQA